jgi:predicted acyl esterase
MRWWAMALLTLLLAGCFGGTPPTARLAVPADVGYDPTTIRIDDFRAENLTIVSWDGITHLSVVAYVPQTSTRLADGSAPRWPLAVFVHGWGEEKEQYEGQRSSVPGAPIPDGSSVNALRQFALGGLVAVAYDARGFGQSEGQATVAGSAEMQDLDAVIDFAAARYGTSGRVGVIGLSYGGGHAYQAWANDAKVTTAVAMYGWVDLYNALIPQNVPKLEWAQALYTYGAAGARGDYDPMIHEWYKQLYTRRDLGTVHRQMDERSVLPRMLTVHKPLLICQGMQESLFPQADQAWSNAGGFTRAIVFTGGHGARDATCWQRSLSWFQFFLGGYDHGVDKWPALQTVDASGLGGWTEYPTFPKATDRAYHLRLADLDEGDATGATFTIQQRLAANPLNDPAALWDRTGQPSQVLPDELRQDPTASFFAGKPIEGTHTLIGEPHLRLHVREGTTPYQVAATLYLVHASGGSLLVSRSAAAALNQTDVASGFLDLPMTWTRAVLTPGDHLELKVASNDPDWWMPLLANYSVTFDGQSTLTVPLT